MEKTMKNLLMMALAVFVGKAFAADATSDKAVYSVTRGNWLSTPSNDNTSIEIDFGDTTGSVNLNTILDGKGVNSISLLTVTGTKGGNIASESIESITINSTYIKTHVVVDSYKDQFGAITIYPNASLKLHAGKGGNLTYDVTGVIPDAGQARPKLIVSGIEDGGWGMNDDKKIISNVDLEVVGEKRFYIRTNKIGEGVALIVSTTGSAYVGMEGGAEVTLIGLSGEGNFLAGNHWSDLSGVVTINLPDGVEKIFNGAFTEYKARSAKGSLIVSGTGELTLAGENDYSGGTTIASGATLVVTHANALGTGSVTLDGALTFKDVEATLSNQITQTNSDNTTNPTGQIVIDNSIVTLNGANGNYKGLITINEGATLKTETFHYAPIGNGASIVNNGTIDIKNTGTGICGIQAAISGKGALTVSEGALILTGANTYNGATTIAKGAKVIANSDKSSTWDYVSNDDKVRELDITVNGELEIQSSGQLYRGFAGAGKIVINADAVIGNTGDQGFTSGLSRFEGTLVVAAEKTLTLKTWNNPYEITLKSLALNGTIDMYPTGGNGRTVSIKTSRIEGNGNVVHTSQNSGNYIFALLDEAEIDEAEIDVSKGHVTVESDVTVGGSVTVLGVAGAEVLTCNNAADIAAKLMAPEGLMCVVDGNTIKLAKKQYTITLPTIANATWSYGGATVTDSITVNHGDTVELTLNAADGYQFENGQTSVAVTFDNVNDNIAAENETFTGITGAVAIKINTWGGIDWTLTADGVLTIKPTAGTPTKIANRPKEFEVGEWPEAVRYNTKGEGVEIAGWPYDRSKVKKLVIEEGVTKIGSFTAQGFNNLTGEVVIPWTVTYIGQEAFQRSQFTKLTFGKVPAGKEDEAKELCIAQGAFKNLEIEEATLPDDRPVHLHAWIFNNCHKLKRVTFPAMIKSMHGTNHIDYFKNFESHSNPTWTKSSELLAYDESIEVVTFGSEEVKNMFFNINNGTSKDYIKAVVGLKAYGKLQLAIEEANAGDTIKLIKDITENVTVNKPINFTGKTIKGEITIDPKSNLIVKRDANGKIIGVVVPEAVMNSVKYAPVQEAIDAAQDGDVITLIADVTLTEPLKVDEGKTITLDLNGHNITMDESLAATGYAIENSGTLTLIDSGTDSGSVQSRGILNNGTLYVENGTYNAVGDGSAIVNNGEAYLTGGTFTAESGYSLNNASGATMSIGSRMRRMFAGVVVANGIYSNGDLLINGGEIYDNSGRNAICVDGDNAANSSAVINGGTITGGLSVNEGAGLEIVGGVFNGDKAQNYDIKGNVSIKGGAFLDDAAKSFAHDNVTLKDNEVLTVTDEVFANLLRSKKGYYVSQNANYSYSIMLKSSFRLFVTAVEGKPRLGFFQDHAAGAKPCTLLGATNLEKPDWTPVAYSEANDASNASDHPLKWVKLNETKGATKVYRFFKIAE